MDKKKLKKIVTQDFGPGRILLLALAGIILLGANISEHKKEKKEEKNEDTLAASQTVAAEDYTQKLENRLIKLLEGVDGVGQVEVMITLKSSGEAILNKDISSESQTEEESGKETTKKQNTVKKEEETVLSDGSGAQSPYVIKQMELEIAGVIISCEGADNNSTAQAVMEAACVVFGIEPSHIKVLKMEVKK